jgi:hypothetical protein
VNDEPKTNMVDRPNFRQHFVNSPNTAGAISCKKTDFSMKRERNNGDFKVVAKKHCFPCRTPVI